MADCKKTLEELQQYLDRELSSGAHTAIQGHLDGCMDCLSAYDFEAELRQVIAAKCRKQEPVPQSLMERIQACFGIEEADLGHTQHPAD